MLKKRWLRGLAVGLAAFLIAFGLDALHAFRRLEWKSWDGRMKAFAAPGRADPNIVLILVDQASLDVYAKQGVTWPWPREFYEAIVRHLAAGGAKAVFFDIAMTEGSRFGVEDDRVLASAMTEAGNVFVPVFLSVEEKDSPAAGAGVLKGPPSPPPARLVSGEVFRSITLPLEEYLTAARGIGNVRLNPDPDTIYRAVPLLFDYRGSIVPSASWALASFVSPAVLDPALVPVDADGRMIVRFFGPAGTYKAYAAAGVVNSFAQAREGQAPQLPPAEFAGKIVLVGLSAVGLYDIKASPLSGVVPGVEIQAAALDTLLNRHYFRVTPRVPALLYALLLALLAGAVVSSVRRIGTSAAVFGGFLLLPVAASVAAFGAGRWLELVLPETAVLLTLVGGGLLNYGVEGRERRFLKGVFRHYLSPDVIDRIIENPRLLKLGGEQREVTSFFSDVAGFTSISEAFSAHDLVALLNEYLGEMTDIILNTRGTLDKYEGDAIVAFWNAPLDDPAHALNACRAALACQRRLVEMGPGFERRFGKTVRARIGLNTGPAVVGNMGSSRRFDYTAMGDTINLAARLEGACKQFGVSILAGEATMAEAGEAVVAREVDLVRVVGKTKPVRIFELVGEKGAVDEEWLRRVDEFHRGLASFRRREWDKAAAVFATLAAPLAMRTTPARSDARAASGDDPVSRLYVERCRRFKDSPPPDDWDLVFDLKTK